MSWLCRLGLHRHVYLDCAFFSSCRRCGVCDEPLNQRDWQRLTVERQLWSEPFASIDSVARKMKERGEL